MARPLYFELHIRPMIRLIDRDHMRYKINLHDAEAVTILSQTILDHLESDMPPADSGGPWPTEWIETFRRWKDEGCKRLDLGRGTFTAKRHGGVIDLRAAVVAPKPTNNVWLERVPSTDDVREYVLYVEPAEGDPDPTQFDLLEKIPAAGVTTIVVSDADGRREVPIV